MLSYPWYTGDWRSSETRTTMNGEQRGLYRELLDQCWEEGSLPADPRLLRKLADFEAEEFDRAWPRVSEEFVLENGRLYHLKVEQKREDILKKKDKRAGASRENGKHGGRPPNNLDNLAPKPTRFTAGNPPAETPSPSPSPSPSTVIKEHTPRGVLTMEPFQTTDGDVIVERILAACLPRHPIPGSVELARSETFKRIRGAPDPARLADEIIAAHAKFCEYWKVQPPDPKRLFAWWIRDGDYLHPPQVVPQPVLSRQEQALKALWPQGRPST